MLSPGFYAIGEMVGKGLEFDNVIVDYNRMIADDLAGEKRLRYVHFTRRVADSIFATKASLPNCFANVTPISSDNADSCPRIKRFYGRCTR